MHCVTAVSSKGPCLHADDMARVSAFWQQLYQDCLVLYLFFSLSTTAWRLRSHTASEWSLLPSHLLLSAVFCAHDLDCSVTPATAHFPVSCTYLTAQAPSVSRSEILNEFALCITWSLIPDARIVHRFALPNPKGTIPLILDVLGTLCKWYSLWNGPASWILYFLMRWKVHLGTHLRQRHTDSQASAS